MYVAKSAGRNDLFRKKSPGPNAPSRMVLTYYYRFFRVRRFFLCDARYRKRKLSKIWHRKPSKRQSSEACCSGHSAAGFLSALPVDVGALHCTRASGKHCVPAGQRKSTVPHLRLPLHLFSENGVCRIFHAGRPQPAKLGMARHFQRPGDVFKHRLVGAAQISPPAVGFCETECSALRKRVDANTKYPKDNTQPQRFFPAALLTTKRIRSLRSRFSNLIRVEAIRI